MKNNKPLEKFSHQAHALTAEEVIQRLRKNDFLQVYETENGVVNIQDESSLNCKVKKNSNNTWTPDISIDLYSGDSIFYWVGLKILVIIIAAFSHMTLLGISAILVFMLGRFLLLTKKKKATLQRLKDALSE